MKQINPNATRTGKAVGYVVEKAKRYKYPIIVCMFVVAVVVVASL